MKLIAFGHKLTEEDVVIINHCLAAFNIAATIYSYPTYDHKIASDADFVLVFGEVSQLKHSLEGKRLVLLPTPKKLLKNSGNREPRALAFNQLTKLQEQIRQLESTPLLDQSIITIKKDNNTYLVITDKGESLVAEDILTIAEIEKIKTIMDIFKVSEVSIGPRNRNGE
jgi:hypothetical protein